MAQDNDELTYGEHKRRDTFWDDVKEPFPKLEDIEWVKMDAPEWLKNSNVAIMPWFGNTFTHVDDFKNAKRIYENSKDFTVTWELKS